MAGTSTLREPQQAVQENPALIEIAPVGVRVAPGEAETRPPSGRSNTHIIDSAWPLAATIWSYGPLGLTYGPFRTSSLGVATRIGVTRFWTAGSVDQRMLKYHSSCVANGATPRAIGWLRELVERRLPHRIHRVVILVVAADPAVHRLSRRTRRYLDAVVSEPEADALRGKSIDDFHVVSLDRGVPRPPSA